VEGDILLVPGDGLFPIPFGFAAGQGRFLNTRSSLCITCRSLSDSDFSSVGKRRKVAAPDDPRWFGGGCGREESDDEWCF